MADVTQAARSSDEQRTSHASLRAELDALTPAHGQYVAARARAKALGHVADAAAAAAAGAALCAEQKSRRGVPVLGRKKREQGSERRRALKERLESEAGELKKEVADAQNEAFGLEEKEDRFLEVEREVDGLERDAAARDGVGAGEEEDAEMFRRVRGDFDIETLRGARVEGVLVEARKVLISAPLRETAAAVQKAEEIVAEAVSMQPKLPVRKGENGRVLLADLELKNGKREGFRKKVKITQEALRVIERADRWNRQRSEELRRDRKVVVLALREAEERAKNVRKNHLISVQ